MFTTADELVSYIKESEIEVFDIRFCDLPGVMQHLTVPAASVDVESLAAGMAFDGSSVRGFQGIHESDMLLLPDIATARVDPFRTRRTLTMNFFVHDPLTLQPYTRDPRNVARKAQEYLAGTGFADTAFFGAEAEFYIFDEVRYESSVNGTFYRVDSESGAWNSGREEPGGNKGYKVRPKGGYFPVAPYDHYGDLRDEMVANLIGAGRQVERAHHEVGTGGQAEINYRFNTLLAAADDLMMFKYIVKNTAWAAGKSATFMPKPLVGDNGSGMHCHQSLWLGGQPLFYDETGYGGLSDMARHYIGGILHHAPSLLAFTNPTVNSYHRLVPGYEAPVNLVYSARNRSACIRIPLTGTSPILQPLPGVLGDAHGRPGRHPQPHRTTRAHRQRPLRPRPRRSHRRRPNPRLAGRGHRPPRSRPRLPPRRRRLHLRPHRHLDPPQAHHRDRTHPTPPPPLRIRPLLRPLNRAGWRQAARRGGVAAQRGGFQA